MPEIFVRELHRQFGRATTALRRARLADDDVLVEAMSGRLADLQEIARRNGLELA